MWEDYFDEIVRLLGLGIPMIAIDGVTRPDYLPPSSSMDVRISTDKPNNIFAPGDKLVVFVENRGRSPVFIELIGTGTKGEKVVLVPAGREIAAGGKLRFPETGSINVQAALGREDITVFASESKFAGGRILRAENVDDRFVHGFYQIGHQRGGPVIGNSAEAIARRTLQIESR